MLYTWRYTNGLTSGSITSDALLQNSRRILPKIFSSNSTKTATQKRGLRCSHTANSTNHFSRIVSLGVNVLYANILMHGVANVISVVICMYKHSGGLKSSLTGLDWILLILSTLNASLTVQPLFHAKQSTSLCF
jgi:hypothetical protein